MEKYFLITIIIIITLLSVSCKNSQAFLDVIEGNYAFSRGEYQVANFDYLKVKKNEVYGDYISYNLGNVYYALGEIDSAFNEWQSVSEDMESEISVLTYFNMGVLLFELSRYEDSYKVFRNILEFDPSNIDAKINLEYCIQKMNFSTQNKISPQNTSSGDAKEPDDVSRILDFVKRRENNIWKSVEKAKPDSSGLRDW